ncbi:MAG: hypothetical protein ACFFHV_19380 [Promethearchaeota archaeon]
MPLGLVLLYIVYKILKRNPKNRLNQLFSLFYISLITAITLNAVYATFSDPSLETLASFLNVLAFYFSCLAAGFLFECIFMLYNPRIMAQIKNQILFILIYGGIMLILFFIPGGATIKILDNGTQLSPVWNFPFFAFSLTIVLILFILSFWMSIRIYSQFENRKLAKRFLYFIIGIFIFYYIPIGVTISNYLNSPGIRLIFGISAGIIFIGVIFIYYGIGESIQDNEINA